VGQVGTGRRGLKLVSQASAKVATQDLCGVLPVYHLFGHIGGGVYWKPAFNLLDGQFELLVVNAQHIKAVPGRNTDVRDAEWIADLLQHGLLTSSFIPPTAQRELRDLTRHRVSLVVDRARVFNRLQKVLADTNSKLGDVATDILGKSARAMLDSMLSGQSDPQVLANLARGRLRAKRAELEQALVGVFKPHHRFLPSRVAHPKR
jgi:transposase